MKEIDIDIPRDYTVKWGATLILLGIFLSIIQGIFLYLGRDIHAILTGFALGSLLFGGLFFVSKGYIFINESQIERYYKIFQFKGLYRKAEFYNIRSAEIVDHDIIRINLRDDNYFNIEGFRHIYSAESLTEMINIHVLEVGEGESIQVSPEEIKEREEKALRAIKAELDIPNKDSAVTLFCEDHLDQLEGEYWKKHIGTVKPDPVQVVDLLVLKDHWDGDTVFDFTLPEDVTDYIICVRFDENGEVEDIDIES